jgi:hypothetical protein
MVYTTISSGKITAEDELKLLGSCLLKFAWSDTSLSILKAWLSNTDPNLTNLQPNLQEKWTILSYLYARPFNTTQEFLATYQANLVKEDQTDIKKEFAYKIESLTANDSKRLVLMDGYLDTNSEMSWHVLGLSMRGFNSMWVPYEKREKFHGVWNKNIVGVLKGRPREVAKVVYGALKPVEMDFGKTIARNEELEESLEGFDGFWQKLLKEDFDSDRRKWKVLKFAGQGQG